MQRSESEVTKDEVAKGIDRYRGCLIGVSVGDALGYPIEFRSEEDIFDQYGADGITDYALTDGVALISDDTQMTLFTATGLLQGTTMAMTHGATAPYEDYIWKHYLDWYKTQNREFEDVQKDGHHDSWLVNIPQLFSRRAPGLTCFFALQDGIPGALDHSINTSKGCGGIMRVAPVGLYREAALHCDDSLDIIGAKAAALTHTHELGCIPAAALVHIIDRIVHEGDTIAEAVDDAMARMPELFPQARHMDEFLTIMRRAIDLADEARPGDADLDAIHQLGLGKVAEETLAIAVYCALRYPDDFESAVIAAVNHKGDSDSTGGVAGAIVGANVGLSAIPRKYLDNLELKQVTLTLADDLYNGCPLDERGPEQGSASDSDWAAKYITATYRM